MWTKLHFCHGIANDIVLSWDCLEVLIYPYTHCLHVSAVSVWCTWSVKHFSPAWRSTPIRQQFINTFLSNSFHFPLFSRIFGCPMIYKRHSIKVSCSSSGQLKTKPWFLDLIWNLGIWKQLFNNWQASEIVPASTIQRWAFRADPIMGYHGRYHEISLAVDALIWNDLNGKKMKQVEHLEPWFQSLLFFFKITHQNYDRTLLPRKFTCTCWITQETYS